MKHNRLLLCFLVVALALCSGSALHAQTQLTLLSPNPITEPLDKIVANFQAKTGIQVKITYGTGVSTKKTVADGGALDVTLLFAPFPRLCRPATSSRIAPQSWPSCASEWE